MAIAATLTFMAPDDFDSPTIPTLFRRTVAAHSQAEALGIIQQGRLSWRTWAELAAAVATWQRSLAQFGVCAGDRIVQISGNCHEWIIADLAIQSLGAVHVPLHASLAVPQMAEQATHCGAMAALIADPEVARGFRRHAEPKVRVVLHGDLCAAPAVEGPPPAGVAQPSPDALATILYTSGTTGAPQGVMLTARNIAVNAKATTEIVCPGPNERRLCILPLSHIYARTCDLYSWIYHGGKLVLAESRETVFRDCELARPTAINAVPYFYQKVADRLRSAIGNPDAAAVRAVFGGAIENCYCGGAALAPDVDQFFAERGLPILCGYGLTEASPVISATTADTYRSGTVGRPLPNVEVRLAEDGEVLARGENIMAGYWNNETETTRALRDGWLHTGDLGQLDPDGHLRIVGRKKEIIVLATGKKVAPTRIEQLLSASPLIEQACVVGDGRKFLAAIIVPNGDALREEIERRRLFVWSKRRATTHPTILTLYREEIDRCLAGAAQFEQVGAFILLPRAFAVDRGEVTLKLSLCRGVIAGNFANEIEALYRQRSGVADGVEDEPARQ